MTGTDAIAIVRSRLETAERTAQRAMAARNYTALGRWNITIDTLRSLLELLERCERGESIELVLGADRIIRGEDEEQP